MQDAHHYINQVYGHSKAKDLLLGFITSEKIPHAIILTGNDGIGKDFLAIQFTKALNNIGSANTNLMSTISKIGNLEEPYIKFIFPLPRGKNETDDSGPTEKFTEEEIESVREELQKKINNPYYKINLSKANNIKINSIRDIKKFLSVEFGELEYRVVIISDAHLMNDEAQNALLKNLEEPPENVFFILNSSQPGRLRETILSRCWRINLDPINENDLVEILSKYYNIGSDLAQKIAPFAEGSALNAIKLYEMDFLNLKEKTISILRNAFGRKYHSAYEELNTVLGENTSKNFEVVLKLIITWVNDLNRLRNNVAQNFFKDHIETLQKFQNKFPDVELANLIFDLDHLASLVKRNINLNLLASNLFFLLSNIVLAPSDR